MNYKKLFWGFIFLFDLRIGGFDLLLDIIGFILIFMALNAMKQQNEHYGRSSILAIPLIFMSIFNIYQNPAAQANWFSIIIGVLISILSIATVYGICMGIKEQATKIGDANLSSETMTKWKLYLISNVIILFVIFIPVLGVILAIPTMLFSIISYVLMIILMKNAERSLENYQIRS